MKILHLFSNSKWTGPAEPALRLCLALRDAGVDIHFACQPQAKSGHNKVVSEAEAHGLVPIKSLYLNKHRNPVQNRFDSTRLASMIEDEGFDIIHCHLDNDHRIALHPATRGGVPLVRSNYDGSGFRDERDIRSLIEGTSLIIEPSQRAMRHDAETYDLSPKQLAMVSPAVDLERFDPSRELPDGRTPLNLPDDAFVIGIIARMQPQRHFEDLWDALARMRAAGINAHVVVAGRGSKQDQVAREPVRARGMEPYVHLPGFADGDEFVARIAAFDVNVYLVPGTDGTCRAVREALAMGKPCVVSQRGMLSELVVDGETGCVCDGSAAELASALAGLARNPEERRQFGSQARVFAVDRFSGARQANAVIGHYERLLT